MEQDKIGKFILVLRKEKNMTQQELADKLLVTDRAVSHWENGRSIPDVSLFKPICELFDISINELISGERLTKKDLLKVSEENIIKTINDSNKKKEASLMIIKVLVVGIIALLLIILIVIRSINPKIYLDNFTIQSVDDKDNFGLVRMVNIDDRDVYYYGLDFALFCSKNKDCYSADSALKKKQITLDLFRDYLERQFEYNNITKYMLYDGGSTIYSKDGYEVIFCNSIDGNRDVYIGNSSMIDNLNGSYCGHERNSTEHFIRTYKVVSASIVDNEFNRVVLEDKDGSKEEAIINNSYDLIVGHTYEFYFTTYKEFDDSIENIFEYSTLIKVIETDKVPSEYINEKIIVNKELESGVELNELDNVTMSISPESLTKTSAKIVILDYSGNKYVYGSDYYIDKKVNGVWTRLEYIHDNIAFNSMAYGPDINGRLQFDVNWEYAYGKLKRGKYRIVKSVLIDSEPCDEDGCNHYYISVEFDI